MAPDSIRAEAPPISVKEWPGRKLAVYQNRVIVMKLWGRVPEGRETVEMARALGDAVDECEGGARLYVDVGELVHYDTQVRVLCTEVLRARYANLDELVVYAETSLVRMGVSVARLALPKLMPADRDEFHARLRRRLAGR